MNPTTKSLVFGTAAGLLTICAYLLAYFLNKDLFFSPWLTYGTFLFYLAAMYWVALQTRDAIEGPFLWKDALRVAFLTFVVAHAWYYVFYYVVHQLDPSLAEMQKELMREALPRFTEPARLPEAYRELDENDFRVTPGMAFFGWAQGAIFGFVLAALVGLITKRDMAQPA